jgi:hypothetical protein
MISADGFIWVICIVGVACLIVVPSSGALRKPAAAADVLGI